MPHAQVFADSPNVTVVEIPINDGWTRDVSSPALPCQMCRLACVGVLLLILSSANLC